MCLYPITIKTRPKEGEPRWVTVSCGKCLQCAQQKSIEWAFRILDEASQYEHNAFITLTYNDDNLPPLEEVSQREVQLFMKRLRQEVKPLRIRFFACGEYGAKFYRPHYHLIIFGWFPDDAWFFKNEGKSKLFRSPQLEKVWQKGFSTVAKVTYETALYCAKYMNKYQYDLGHAKFKGKQNYYMLAKPFVQMSNRPGIGFNSVYKADLKCDRIYRNGKSTKIPRYYLKVMERDGVYLDDFRELRQKQGELVSSVTDIEANRKKYKELFHKMCVKHNLV